MDGCTVRVRGVRWYLVQSIRLGSFNICKEQNGGLESALCGVSTENGNLGIIQDKKVMRGN